MKYTNRFLLVTLVSFAALDAFTQTAQQKITQFRQTNETAIITEYIRFLSLPNVSADSANMPLNAAFIVQMMTQRGIPATLLHGKTAGVTPAVFGEIKVPGATKTIAYYAHYDGQPVNPKQWAPGLEPFTPVFITAALEQGGTIINYKKGDDMDAGWRLSGRGSADDKAGIMVILNAYDALVKSKIKPTHNIKFFFEGEEEVGSLHLGEIFEQNRAQLAADLWVIVDGPRHVSGKKIISFGVRGDTHLDLTVYGPKRPLHSGNYGNWAPNPAMMLVQLLATMKDEKGNVLIKRFYNDVLPVTAAEKEAIAKVPNIEETLKKELGIASPDGDGKPFLELLLQPTLNINGIQSANTGKLAANIIPVKAEATLDLRLVLGNDAARQIQKVKDHIESKGYHIIDHEPSDAERAQYAKLIKITGGEDGYNAQRTPMNLPAAQSVIKAVQSTVDYPLVLVPSSGGSLPLFIFEKQLGAKVITIPVVNYDNNQHAENENVQLGFLWQGIETLAAVMMMQF